MDNKIERLIEMVKSYPVLYDMSYKDYKNIRLKDKVWDEIGLELNENGDNLRKKWKNLRDSYAKYLKSQKTKSGQAANLNRKWVWADQMGFSKPFLSFAKTTSNVSFDDFDENSLEIDPTFPTFPESSSFNSQIDEVVGETSSSAKTPVCTKRSRRNRLSLSPSSNVGRVINYLEENKKNKEDEIECLMLAHAKTIKKFSLKRQIITKMKIAELIMEQELLNLDDSLSTSSSIIFRHDSNTSSINMSSEYLN